MASNTYNFTRGWWFILPGLTLMVLIVGVPLLMGLRYSLHDVFLYNFGNQNFVGLDNYRAVLTDPLYQRSVRTTAIFTLGCVAFSLVFGMLIAFLLSSKKVRFRSTWMALFLIPFVMTPVVGGIAWRFFIWQQEFGLINQISGFFGMEPRYWLLDRETALFATIVSNAWHLTPLAILVFYAALTTVSEDLLEAARLEGANGMQVLWHILVPLLRPHILFVSIILITSAFREFDMIWALTGGGPGRSTTVLSIFAYNRGVANQDMGMANTIAFTMFIIMAVVAWVYITLYKRSEEKEA